MIPLLGSDGNLPPGVHHATWDELVERFGGTEHRARLLAGLRSALCVLRTAGCRRVYINGSFVTAKEVPGDFDAVWDPAGVDVELLLRLQPAFGDFSQRRAAQKSIFRGEFFPSSLTEHGTGSTFLDFFQIDKLSGGSKGIVAVDLDEAFHDQE
jgi:hypothetical protein